MFLRTISLLLVVTLFYGCPSEELTSARLYVKEKNWEKSEEMLTPNELNDLKKSIKNKMIEEVSGIKGMKDPQTTIKELRKDAGIDDY